MYSEEFFMLEKCAFIPCRENVKLGSNMVWYVGSLELLFSLASGFFWTLSLMVWWSVVASSGLGCGCKRIYHMECSKEAGGIANLKKSSGCPQLWNKKGHLLLKNFGELESEVSTIVAYMTKNEKTKKTTLL